MKRKLILGLVSFLGITILSLPIFVSKFKPAPSNKPLLIPLPQETKVKKTYQYNQLLGQGRKFYQRAISLYNQNQSQKDVLFSLNQAISKYQQAIKLDPSQARAYYLVGRLYDSVKGFYPQAQTQAEKAYQIAFNKDSSNPTYLNSLAYFFWQEHKPLEAKAYLEKGLNFNSNNLDAKILLAKTYTQLGQVDKAINLLADVKTKLVASNNPLLKQVDNQLVLLKKLNRANQAIASKNKIKIITVAPTASPVIKTGSKSVNFSQIPAKQALAKTLIIAQPQIASQAILSHKESNALVGQVVFPKNSQEIKVKNKLVGPNSKIITAIKEKTNQIIFVKSKAEGSFTLSSTSPLPKSLTVAYWIVNKN